MGKRGRPYSVHEDLTQLANLIEDGDKQAISQIVLTHGVNAYDGYKRTALIWSVIFSEIEILKWLIEKGAEVNFQDRTGYTSLHFCGQSQDLKAATMLLKNGANPNIQDEHGNSPLWTAFFNAKRNFELVRLLLTNGADPFHKNLHGRSPDDMALTIYKKGIEELLAN